jgi:hypothetical protein
MTRIERISRILYLIVLIAAWAVGVLIGYIKAKGIPEDLIVLLSYVLVGAYVLVDATLTAEPSLCVGRAITILPIEMVGYLSTKVLLYDPHRPFANMVNADAAYIGTIAGLIYGVLSLATSLVARRLKDRRVHSATRAA